MTAWTPQQLEEIGSTDDFHISPYRDDGTTPGTPTWIWSVVVEGDVYVRAYNGPASRWHSSAMTQGLGASAPAASTLKLRSPGGRRDQRPHRRSLCEEIRRQPVSTADDLNEDSRGDSARRPEVGLPPSDR
ncbi:conserved hypothetical protein [Arthrobacter sp. Hiyo8]|nr:conserved hypothetical protein [Arthrobacter sp. Hiyo8]